MFDGLGSSAAHIKNGRIKALAVASEKRAPGFPEVPSSIEAGLPTYQVATWYGLWAPKGTPPALIEQMQAEMKKALNSEELKAGWASLGANPPNLWGPDFGRFVGSEIKRWAEVVKTSGAKME
jgi:tripartite-type tricarboxylate transporter receptor subunit TctC